MDIKNIEYTSMAEEAEEAETVAEKYGIKTLPKLDDIEKASVIRVKREKETKIREGLKKEKAFENYVRETFPKVFENALITMNKGYTCVEIKVKVNIKQGTIEEYETAAQNILDNIYKNNPKHRMIIKHNYEDQGDFRFDLYIIRKSIINLWGRIV